MQVNSFNFCEKILSEPQDVLSIGQRAIPKQDIFTPEILDNLSTIQRTFSQISACHKQGCFQEFFHENERNKQFITAVLSIQKNHRIKSNEILKSHENEWDSNALYIFKTAIKELEEGLDSIISSPTHEINHPEDAIKPLLKKIHWKISQIILSKNQQYIHNLYYVNVESSKVDPKLWASSIEKYKRDLSELMKQLGEVWNIHAEKLDKSTTDNKEKLKYIISYVLEEENQAVVKHADTLLNTLKHLIDSFFSKPESEEACLKPSAFFGHKASYNFVPAQQDILSEEHQKIKDKVINFFNDPFKTQLNSQEMMILDWLNGINQIAEMQITQKNARSYLNSIKLIDLALAEHNRGSPEKIAFKKSSFELRTHILKICSPLMTTAEAYTKTLDPRKFRNRHYLSQSSNWVPERVAHHIRIASNQIVKSMAQSKRLNHYVPAIWAVRGNLGVGKTHALANDPYFKSALDSNGNSSGAGTPDNAKQNLRKENVMDEDSFLVNNQVHEEGVTLFKQIMLGLSREGKNASLLLEGRFSTIEELRDGVLNLAKGRNGEVLLIDIECPLVTSLYRILARDPFAHQSAPLLDIVKGYKESIIYRKKLLDIVANEPSVKYFKLYYSDDNGQRHLVAEKLQDKFIIHSEDLLEASCQLPSENEISQIINQEITDEQIAMALGRKDIDSISKEQIYKWKGFSLGKAIEMNSLGISMEEVMAKIEEEAVWLKLYGKVDRQPFTGEWLSGFRELYAFNQSEQLLHLRGIDDEGKGLHWQTNKFSSRLNPDFNPETILPNSERGGFQMRIGYFVIPPDKADTLMTKNLSPAVLKELEIRGDNGDLIGYRFFVHPEAYAHFSALHQASIQFVQPENSEFMGTPTSSYRSWMIRHYLPNQNSDVRHVPFVVKMGVSNSPTDVRRLLPKLDIENSLKAQERLNSIPPEHFNKGGKGADFIIFPENFGMTLKNIENYPPQSATAGGELVDSGMIIREFPPELLKGKDSEGNPLEGNCKFYSFSAILSVERTREQHTNLCSLSNEDDSFEEFFNKEVLQAAKDKRPIKNPEEFIKDYFDTYGAKSLPLIYEMIQAAINKGLVKNAKEFIKTYFIDGYLNATEELFMQYGVPFSPHGQNLCFVLNPDNTPRGFAYRDMEGISHNREIGYLESFSFFYRYHNFIKLLDEMLLTMEEQIKPPIGSPTQLENSTPIPERTLFPYMQKSVKHSKEIEVGALNTLLKFQISQNDYDELLKDLDDSFLQRLGRYFSDFPFDTTTKNAAIPSAEIGSVNETYLNQCNIRLWNNRRPVKLPNFNLPSKLNFIDFPLNAKVVNSTPNKLQKYEINLIKSWMPESESVKMYSAVDIIRNQFQIHQPLSPLGHAIAKRHTYTLKELLQKGGSVDEVSVEKSELTALDLFFRDHPKKGPNALLLEILLNENPSLVIKPRTLFYIAVYSSAEELEMLLNYGLSATTLWKKEESPQSKGVDVLWYNPEVNLLDFVVSQAEKNSLFGDNEEALKKIEILIKFGADPLKCNHFCNQNYLHRVTDVSLRTLLCDAGVDATASVRAYKYGWDKTTKIRPIDLAYDIESIDLYCSKGELRDNSPYLKETSAHISALTRIGFDPLKGPNQVDEKGFSLLLKAAKALDYAAVVALLGGGVDVNAQSPKKGLTALHVLFADYGQGVLSDDYDFFHLSDNEELRIANILIKNGALPLKDNLGRTPLMCLTYNPIRSRCHEKILDTYIDFEAKFHHVHADHYRAKYDILRGCLYKGGETVSEENIRIKSVVTKFWDSFKNRTDFDADLKNDVFVEIVKMQKYKG